MTVKKVYLISLGAVLLASIYPIYMGIVVLVSHIQNGGIDAADYPKYIIPYTPICLAVIICVALLPLAFQVFKKLAILCLTALGTVLFLVLELCFENIMVFDSLSEKLEIESWQLLSCFATPEVMRSVGNPLGMEYSPAFKVHFYLISLLIVFAVIGVSHGFYNMFKMQDFTKKKPLVLQLFCVIAFVGLCVLACFTAFFRTGGINISPLSGILMTIFFVVFGMTAGVYTGTFTYGKKRLPSLLLPAAIAVITTTSMYIGEMVMMGGELYRFGNGFLFNRMGAVPLAFADIAIILVSGLATYFVLRAIKPKTN